MGGHLPGLIDRLRGAITELTPAGSLGGIFAGFPASPRRFDDRFVRRVAANGPGG
jgi:hypothetical protein